MVSPYDLGAVGGVQNQVLQLADQMQARGHHVTVVGPGQLGAEFRFVSLGPSRDVRGNDSVAPISLHPRVVGRMRRATAGVDVIHVHEPLMPLVGIAARWTGKPLVGTFHADPSPRVRWLYRRFAPLRWHMARFAALTAVSPVALSAVETFGDVTVVPNGVRTEGLPPRRPVPGRVVFVGRDDPRKGLDIALAALAIVRERHPDAQLVIVTPDEVQSGSGVEVRRNLDDAGKLELLASADVLIAPNRRGESFGLVVAEAMASACPVVASDLPAFRDVLGDAGTYVAPGDATGLADTLASLLDDASRLDAMSTASAVRARQFSIEHVADAYEQLYRGAVGPDLGDPEAEGDGP